jgi:sulfate transport system substrate-binding protein
MSWLDQINLRVVYKENLPRFRKRSAEILLCLLGLAALYFLFQCQSRPQHQLLHVSFDASRPAVNALNEAWNAAEGQLRATSIHAGSLEQTEALANGLLADTICVSSAGELDRLSQGRNALVSPDWRSQFPDNSSPFTSSIVFIVRPNPKNPIKDWTDILDNRRRIAIPDPLISGVGQYAYLALIYSIEQAGALSPLQIAAALRQVQFLPYAATRSTEVFLNDSQYDALLTWESEALRIQKNPNNSNFRVVYPSYSLLIEPVVAIANSQVDRRGTRNAAEDYLNFYFSPTGQTLIEQAGFRARRPSGTTDNTNPNNKLYSVESLFGNWSTAQALHLGPEGSLARLLKYRNARRGGTE